MPLDPDVRALLDLFVAAGRPPVWQVTPDEAREGMIALARAVDVKDEPIARQQAIVAPGPAGAIECRLYTPSAAGDAVGPGIVYFHGGGFVIGSLDTHDGICRMLANASACRVLSVAYRLAPEHRFPAAVEDAVAATAWALRNAAMLGIDPSRLAVTGDSAGGTLAAVVAQRVPGIALQVLLCPTTDRRAETPSRRDLAEGYFLERASMDWFFDHYVPPGTDPADPRLSPARAADLAHVPPAQIHTAEFDPLRDEAKDYADALAAAGVSVRYTCHAGMIHHFYGMAAAIPYARPAMAAIGAAIRAALA